MKGPTKENAFKNLFTSSVMRRRTLVMFLIWTAASMVYYCISLSSPSLGENKYIICFLSAAIELPAYILCYFSMNKFGRRNTLVFYLLVSGISCIVVAILMYAQAIICLFSLVNLTMSLVFAMIGKFGVTAGFSLIFIYNCELSYTMLRNRSLGFSSTVGRIGAILAPYLIYAGEQVNQEFPYFLMGILTISAGFSAFLLPETSGQPLPEFVKRSFRIGNCGKNLSADESH